MQGVKVLGGYARLFPNRVRKRPTGGHAPLGWGNRAGKSAVDSG